MRKQLDTFRMWDFYDNWSPKKSQWQEKKEELLD